MNSIGHSGASTSSKTPISNPSGYDRNRGTNLAFYFFIGTLLVSLLAILVLAFL